MTVTPPEERPSSTPVVKTLLVTDMVDSTKLIDSLGDVAASRIFARHDALARALMVRHGGTEIDKTDGFLVMFDRPLDAVLCALALHDSISDLARETNVKLAARIGIHLGEVQLRRNNKEDISRGAKPLEVEGICKPVVSRLMSLAMGFQTLISRAASDIARAASLDNQEATKDLVWLTHGGYRFKGIAEPHIVCEVGRVGRSPLTAPPSSAKAWRSTPVHDIDDTGWHPAAGGGVPGLFRVVLERKLGEGDQGALWLGRERPPMDVAETVGIEVSLSALVRPLKRALLLHRVCEPDPAGTDTVSWRLSGFFSVVVVTEGAHEGHFALLTDKPLMCGRDPRMDFQLDDPKVSRAHCVIERSAGRHVVRELSSRNGIFVNGALISREHVLVNGDRITIGETTMEYYGEQTGCEPAAES